MPPSSLKSVEKLIWLCMVAMQSILVLSKWESVCHAFCSGYCSVCHAFFDASDSCHVLSPNHQPPPTQVSGLSPRVRPHKTMLLGAIGSHSSRIGVSGSLERMAVQHLMSASSN